jgi:membrane-bound metal-dependent hydrolase YbcI (DUF457 family)
MEIEVKCIYDKKTIDDFIKHAINFSKGWNIFAIIVFAASSIRIFFEPSNWDNNIFVILLAVFLVLVNFIKPAQYSKIMRDFLNAEYRYVFKDESFLVESESLGISATSQVNYTKVKKIVEKKGYWYIYFSQLTTYIIVKSAMNDYDIRQLQLLLKRKVKKYQTIK